MILNNEQESLPCVIVNGGIVQNKINEKFLLDGEAVASGAEKQGMANFRGSFD